MEINVGGAVSKDRDISDRVMYVARECFDAFGSDYEYEALYETGGNIGVWNYEELIGDIQRAIDENPT